MRNAGLPGRGEAGILLFNLVLLGTGLIGLEHDGNAIKLHALTAAKLSRLAKLNLSINAHNPLGNHRLGMSTGIGCSDRLEKRVKRYELALDLKFVIHSFTFLT